MQIGELLLRDVLIDDGILNNALYSIQCGLVMAQRQYAVNLRVQQAVSVMPQYAVCASLSNIVCSSNIV